MVSLDAVVALMGNGGAAITTTLASLEKQAATTSAQIAMLSTNLGKSKADLAKVQGAMRQGVHTAVAVQVESLMRELRAQLKATQRIRLSSFFLSVHVPFSCFVSLSLPPSFCLSFPLPTSHSLPLLMSELFAQVKTT